MAGTSIRPRRHTLCALNHHRHYRGGSRLWVMAENRLIARSFAALVRIGESHV